MKDYAQNYEAKIVGSECIHVVRVIKHNGDMPAVQNTHHLTK
jgi:hypothetical protein